MRNPWLCLSALLLIAGLVRSGTAATVQDFEDSTTVGWQAGEGSTLAVTTERYKSGSHSLRWTWDRPQATITYRSAADFAGLKAAPKDKPASLFGMWVHSSAPVTARMNLELLQGNNVVGACWFWMDFRGWRPLGARYTDLGWRAGQAVDGLRLHAPDGVPAGSLNLDFVCTNREGGTPPATYQQPWSGNPQRLATAEVYSDRDVSQSRPWLPPLTPADKITPQQRSDMAALAQRMLPALSRPRSGLKPEQLAEVQRQFAALCIQRHGDVITGRPVDGGSFLSPPGAVSMADFVKVCGLVRGAYEVAQKPEDIALLRGMFANLCRHLLDQGWAEGANVGGAGNPYDVRNWPPIFMAMRDVLAEEGLLRDVALGISWSMAALHGDVFAENPSSNMDAFQCFNRNYPALTLMLPDESERLQRLQAFKYHLDTVLTNNTTVGQDGTAYHHWMHHFAYASYSMPTIVYFARDFAPTFLRLSPGAMERLKTYVYANAFACDKYSMPANLLGRAGVPMDYNFAELAYALAISGTPDGSAALDPQMAGLFLLHCSNPQDPRVAELTAKGIKPLALTGHWSFNGTAAALHRRDRWLVAGVGMVKFWRGLEIYGWMENNNYGRYARNGSLLVQSSGDPVSGEASGWRYDGWDWCHWPGATSLVRPQQEMFDGYTMYGNSKPFAGGTSLDQDGAWGMDFEGRDVAFRRSWFFFGNRITSITTDIKSSQDRPCDTTLYQCAMAAPDEKTWVDGESQTGLATDLRLTDGRSHWLLDSQRNGYYVHAGGPPLQIRRGPQEWTYLLHRYLKDKQDDPIIDLRTQRFRETKLEDNAKYFTPSKGDFAKAYLEHGTHPEKGSAVYSLLVETTPEAMGKLARDMEKEETAPYRLLAADSRAHILYDRATDTTAYVLFETGEGLPGEGPLLAAGRPCVVMVRPVEGGLEVSVASSDIARTDPYLLRLSGVWSAGELPEGSTLLAEQASTLVVVPTDYNMPVRFRLLASP